MFTLRQAINFSRNLADNNIGVNFDGWYGWQCWDLVAKVIYEATGIVVNGNAIDLLDSAKAQGIEVVYEAPGVVAKAGDIFVMSVPGSPYGHTGLVIEDSDGITLKTIEQNVDGNWDYLEVGGPARYRTRSYTGMVGYIRPNYAKENELAVGLKMKKAGGIEMPTVLILRINGRRLTEVTSDLIAMDMLLKILGIKINKGSGIG